MRLKTALLLGLALCISSSTFAQKMDKKEKKKWEAMAKDFKKNPEKLKRLVEDQDEFKRQAQEAEDQSRSLQNSLDAEKRKVAQLEQNVTRLNSDLMMARENNHQLSNELELLKSDPPDESSTSTSSVGVTSGVVFRVQVGAYSKGRIPQKIQNMNDITIEEADNFEKVQVGNYQSIDSARSKARQLKSEGFKGAFVVAFKDGSRISLKEAKQY